MATNYDIHEDVKFALLEVIEAGNLVDQCDTVVLMVEPAGVNPTGDR